MSLPETTHFVIEQTIRFISPTAVAAEWALTAVAAVLIAWAPWGSGKTLRIWRNRFRRLAQNKRAAILICALLPVCVRLSMLSFAPVPEPSIHDEFSHLLAADTLAQGRLTNPTHPLWKHFESIHIIQQPTYNSMYPPAQGFFLAVGQVLFHEPWASVVIGVALMCGAICWMMQGWLPPAWAFFGALVVIVKVGLSGLWMNSYMGGAVPAAGGALLIGSLPRLRSKEPRAVHGLWLGAGLVILMNSRPFEGSVLGCAALIYLCAGWWRCDWPQRRRVLKLLTPAALLLVCGFAFTAFYNWKVTGNPLRMPYQVNRDTYGWPENLAFLPLKQVTLRHKALQDMYALEARRRDIYTSTDRFIENLAIRIFDSWSFFIGPILTVALVLLPWIWQDRRTRPLHIFMGVMAALNLFQMVLFPYHLGPIVPIIFTLVAQALRHVYVGIGRSNRLRGIYFAMILPVFLIVVGAMKQQAENIGIPLTYWEHAAENHRDARAYIQGWLASRPAKQLVVVRYSAEHEPSREWVYNRADIDHSKVVWAREMDKESNARLRDYFRDREAWLLAADVLPPHLVRWQ